MRAASSRLVLDARQADVKVAAGDRSFDRRPRDLHEHGFTTESARDHFRDLDIEAAHFGGFGRVGLDEWGAPFGVTSPPERLVWRAVLRRAARGERDQGRENEAAPRREECGAMVHVADTMSAGAAWGKRRGGVLVGRER